MCVFLCGGFNNFLDKRFRVMFVCCFVFICFDMLEMISLMHCVR